MSKSVSAMVRRGLRSWTATARSGVFITLALALALPIDLQGQQGSIVVEGALVETKADFGCAFLLTTAPQRYVDCQNGTVLDTYTDLVWLKNAKCLPLANYPDAMRTVLLLHDGVCGLKDRSQFGDWRLPTKDEWQDSTAAAHGLGCVPKITNHNGSGCWVTPFIPVTGFYNVQAEDYWASTTNDNPTNTDAAWVWKLGFASGGAGIDHKILMNYSWPVRGAR